MMEEPIVLDAQQVGQLANQQGFSKGLANKIILGDCLQIMKLLPPNSIDLIHTSPPYNIDKQYAESLSDRNELNYYDDFLHKAISEMKRVLRPGGSIFWQTGYTHTESGLDGDILPIDIATYRHFREPPIEMALWDRIIWRYWGGHAFKRKLTNKHETILWYVKPGLAPIFCVDMIREKAKEYDRRNNFWGRNPGNVWEVDRVAYGSTEQTSHIAVFPEEISEKIIRACTNPDDLVLDPFCGSGTVPKVARSLARRWVGIEISPVYVRESAKRIGFQQPSELGSLISELIKWTAFGNKPGLLDVSAIIQALDVWKSGVDVGSIAEQFDIDVSDALGTGHTSANRKRAIWAKYDDLLKSSPSRHPVLLADRLLMRCYKNRRNLNGVNRYKSALELVGMAVDALDESGAATQERITNIALEESSSFQVSGSSVCLVSVDRKIIPETSIPILDESSNPNEDVPQSPPSGQKRLL